MSYLIFTFGTEAEPPAQQYLRPISDIATNDWLPSTGSDCYATCDEVVADSADYAYSPPNPTTQLLEMRLSAGSDPATDEGHAVDVELTAVGQDTTFDLDLVENATVRDSWSETVTAGQTVQRTRNFASGVIAPITDFGNLRVRHVARAP